MCSRVCRRLTAQSGLCLPRGHDVPAVAWEDLHPGPSGRGRFYRAGTWGTGWTDRGQRGRESGVRCEWKGQLPSLGPDALVKPACDCSNLQITSNQDALRKTWNPKFTLRSHFDSVRSLAFHPVEPVLVTASEDHTLKLWNLQKTAPTKK